MQVAPSDLPILVANALLRAEGMRRLFLREQSKTYWRLSRFFRGTKAHSSTLAPDFFFLNPGRAWVQDTLLYKAFGEFVARPLFLSAPAALIRWLIDQW